MPKRRLTLRIALPCYCAPRNRWRRKIHERLLRERARRGVYYTETDHLELLVVLYLRGRALEIHDVDNRLKDLMDALQGRAGGSKRIRSIDAIVPNDRQIYKVTIRKTKPPKQSRDHGYLTVRKLSR